MLIAPAFPAPGAARPDAVEHAARDSFRALRLDAGQTVLIALSGGGDSTALLHLFARYRDAERADLSILAVTVDHRLRPESATEARAAARRCAAARLTHCTVVRQGEAPAAGIQDAARRARYRLLAGTARRHGAPLVLAGHTADDQAETMWMRKARAAGGAGLAGIAPATRCGGDVWFARPLLGLRRADLRGWLAAHALDWTDDPSNGDVRFERVRARRRLAGDAALTRALRAEAAEAAGRRAARARAGAACLADTALWHGEPDHLRFTPTAAACHDAAGLNAAMAAMLALVGALPRLPDAARSARALDFAARAPHGAALTLAGCVLRKRGGAVAIAREARNRRAPADCLFAALLPSFEWPLAAALAARQGAGAGPPPPFAASGFDRPATMVAPGSPAAWQTGQANLSFTQI